LISAQDEPCDDERGDEREDGHARDATRNGVVEQFRSETGGDDGRSHVALILIA
jgi:hypothetical protein